jgi:SRSO17 transposase
MTFIKQGRHSVGVQRQLSSTLGRKVNCQVAVVLHHATATRAVPLELRLYLPRNWVGEKAKLSVAGVPAEHQAQSSKAAIALDLIARARASGVPFAGIGIAPGLSVERELREGLEQQGLTYLGTVSPELHEARTESERVLVEALGLDDFEGRSWRGFHHHACLVLLARAYQLLTP